MKSLTENFGKMTKIVMVLLEEQKKLEDQKFRELDDLERCKKGILNKETIITKLNEQLDNYSLAIKAVQEIK